METSTIFFKLTSISAVPLNFTNASIAVDDTGVVRGLEKSFVGATGTCRDVGTKCVSSPYPFLAHKLVLSSQTEAGERLCPPHIYLLSRLVHTKIFNIPTPLLCYSWVRALGLRWKGNFHIINQNLDCLGACWGSRTGPRHNVHGNIFNGTCGGGLFSFSFPNEPLVSM